MYRRLSLAVGAALLGCSGVAFAITDSETNASIPFSFASPGARSLGMGGAFIGLADDATAAYANPAGLTQLRQTEISLEGRHTSYSTPYIDGGGSTLNPFTTTGLRTNNADTSENNLSYLSVVIPHDRWAFAFYRQELARFHTSFLTLEGADVGPEVVLFPFSSDADLRILSYSATAAYKVSDRVSLGLGLSYYDFRFETVTGRVDDLPQVPIAASGQVQDGDDDGYGWNLGARFALSDSLSLGLTYRRAPDFKYRALNVIFSDGGVPLPDPAVFAFDGVRFDIPDVWGAGLSWRPTDALIVNFDVNRVEYSQLTDNITSIFGIQSSANRLRLEDGTEVHLGAEYTFAGMTHPFSLRGGVWHDPRHSVKFDGTPNTLEDAVLATLFAGGRGADTHYAIGGGWAFSKFQVDFAADWSEGVDTYSLSGVYRF
ncbi:OmpP1/FadL family transporter [Tahibacter soli]|uniref:Outer membrane protein transport protein n=1 Tax=Tahibacter soli TaxID=2983605 RepID=A0A9X4BGA2_9GAMM|nr:outer membrane protein transport protein [Tahibacter soli]MDC8011246.1 outer membrane protein transport protein [Tahibacter soli]